MTLEGDAIVHAECEEGAEGGVDVEGSLHDLEAILEGYVEGCVQLVRDLASTSGSSAMLARRER